MIGTSSVDVVCIKLFWTNHKLKTMEFYRKYFATFWLDWQVFLMTINLYTYLDKRLTMFDRGNKSANLFYRPIFCLLSFMRAWRNQIAHRYSWSLISSTARIITWFSSTSLWWWWTRAQIWNLRIKKLFLSYRVFLPHFLCKVILIERVFELFWEANSPGKSNPY